MTDEQLTTEQRLQLARLLCDPFLTYSEALKLVRADEPKVEVEKKIAA